MKRLKPTGGTGIIATAFLFAPLLSMARPLGVDVSSYQGTVDWASAYSGGVRFAIVKATEGSSYTNPDFSSQINGATNADIVAGAYDFADFNTTSATTSRCGVTGSPCWRR